MTPRAGVPLPVTEESPPETDDLLRPPVVSLTPDRHSLTLSEAVVATLRVEGPAPLRVELPSPLLLPASDAVWRLRPLGPPVRTPAAGGREVWTQTFRLDPYAAGELHVLFAPLRVNDREVSGPGFVARVTTTVTDVDPQAARPVTGVEDPPPLTLDPGPPVSLGWVMLGVILLMAAATIAYRVVLRRRPLAVPPLTRARAALDALDRSGCSGPALAEGLAVVVRDFLQGHYGLPAGRLTTAELLAAAGPLLNNPETFGLLRAALEGLDRIRFGGATGDVDMGREGLTRVRQWLDRLSVEEPRPS